MKNIVSFSVLVGMLVQKAQYRLTVIEDEEVPLAAGIKMEYFVPTIIAMVLTVLLIGVILYLLKCSKYRMQITGLDTEGTSYKGWKLSRLKETVKNLEAEKVDQMFRDDLLEM